MKKSSEQVAKLIGISNACLSRYIRDGKVAAPPETMAGGMRMRLWSESDIEGLRKALPKITNGRKTRYKKQSAISSQSKQKRKRRQECLRHTRRVKPNLNGQRPVFKHRTRPNRQFTC